jgi:hypothetical protein
MAPLDLNDHHLASQPDAVAALQVIHDSIETLSERLLPIFSGGGDVYTTDFLVFAVAKRMLSVGRAFLQMIAMPNFGVAAALLRMQLDTALRFSAMALVESPSQFASDILADKRIDKMTSRGGQRLTDRYLLERLAKSFPWVGGVYESTSGFIHLSGRHMYQTFSKVNDADKTVNFIISAEDVPRPPKDYVEIVRAFADVTRLCDGLLFSWLGMREK